MTKTGMALQVRPTSEAAKPRPRVKRVLLAAVRPFNIFAVARLEAARHLKRPIQVEWDGKTLIIFTTE